MFTMLYKKIVLLVLLNISLTTVYAQNSAQIDTIFAINNEDSIVISHEKISQFLIKNNLLITKSDSIEIRIKYLIYSDSAKIVDIIFLKENVNEFTRKNITDCLKSLPIKILYKSSKNQMFIFKRSLI